ncbi:hypothetical protein D3C85_1461160 [compost metagenome]
MHHDAGVLDVQGRQVRVGRDLARWDQADSQFAENGLPDRFPAADLQRAAHRHASRLQGVLGQLARHRAGFAQEQRMLGQVGQADLATPGQGVVPMGDDPDRVRGDPAAVQMLVIHQKG